MTTPPDAAARPASLDALLAFAWDAGEFTAADAMSQVQLTRSTTIDAIDALLDRGLLLELPNSRAVGDYRKGRPARRFTVRSDSAVVVGLDSGRAHLAVTVADLSGTPLGEDHRDFDPVDESPGARRRAVLAAIDAALISASRDASEILAICAGVAAPVDRRGRSPEHRDGFWQVTNPGLKELLEQRAPLVRVENDATLAAIAEGAFGAAIESRDYVALLAGDRLGAGVVVDGRILRGAHGGVGEMVAFDHVAGVEGAYGLGYRAAKAAQDGIASGEFLASSPLALLPPSQLDGRAVLELAAAGDRDARRIVEHVGATLARVTSVLGSMYDPERVIVTGPVTAGVDMIVEAANRLLPTGLDLPAPRVMTSPLGPDVVVRGAVARAVALGRKRALDFRPGMPHAGSSERRHDETRPEGDE